MTPAEFKKEFFPGIDEDTLLWRIQFVFEPCIHLPQELWLRDCYSKLLREVDPQYIKFKQCEKGKVAIEFDDTGCMGAIIRGNLEETALQLKLLRQHLENDTVSVWGKDTMDTKPTENKHKYQNWLRGLVADAECITLDKKGLATNVTEVIILPLIFRLNAGASQAHALKAYSDASRNQKLPWGHGKNKAYNQKIFFQVELPDGTWSRAFPSYTSWEDIGESSANRKKWAKTGSSRRPQKKCKRCSTDNWRQSQVTMAKHQRSTSRRS